MSIVKQVGGVGSVGNGPQLIHRQFKTGKSEMNLQRRRRLDIICGLSCESIAGDSFTVNVRFVVFVCCYCCCGSYCCGCFCCCCRCCCCLCLTIKPFAVYNHGVPLNRIKSVRQAIPGHKTLSRPSPAPPPPPFPSPSLLSSPSFLTREAKQSVKRDAVAVAELSSSDSSGELLCHKSLITRH